MRGGKRSSAELVLRKFNIKNNCAATAILLNRSNPFCLGVSFNYYCPPRETMLGSG